MTDRDAMEKANEEGQGLTKSASKKEVEDGLADANCEEHRSTGSIALTGLPMAWEGDSTVPAATREIEEDDAINGTSQKRLPAGSL